MRPAGDSLQHLEPIASDAPARVRLLGAVRHRLAPVVGPLSLFGAAILFILLAAQRAWFFGPRTATGGRYLYAYAVFTIPLIALAIQKLADRWKYAGPLLALLVVIGIPSNIRHFQDPLFGPAHHRHNRDFFTNVLRSPALKHAPDDMRPDPDPFVSPGLTIAFLRQAEAEGKMPKVDTPIPMLMRPTLKIRLGLDQRSSGWVRLPCTPKTVERLQPEVGESFYIEADTDVKDLAYEGPQYPTRLMIGHGSLVTPVAPDLDLGLSTKAGDPVNICIIDGA